MGSSMSIVTATALVTTVSGSVPGLETAAYYGYAKKKKSKYTIIF